MTESVYDYGTLATDNVTSERFPASGTFAEFNNRMRTLMAAVAAFEADRGGSSLRDATSTVYTGGVSEDGVITLVQPVTPPLPTGFVLSFRMVFNHTHPQFVATKGARAPLWLSVGGVAHPLLAPGGGVFDNYKLRHDSIYTAVFDGAAWRLISGAETIGFSDKPIVEVTATGGTLTLSGTHIGSTLIVSKDPANTTGELNIVVPAKLPNRWPLWTWIEVFQEQHDVVTLNFDDPLQAAPVTIASAGAGGAVPAGVVTNSVVYFRIGRHSPLEVNFIEYPRGVR